MVMPILSITKKRQKAAPISGLLKPMSLLLNQSVSYGSFFQNMFVDLELDPIATFPFRLGRSGSELVVFEGTSPIFFSGGW